MMSPQNARRWLLLILGGALILRLIAAFGLQYALDHRLHRQFLVEGDANGYWSLGESIVEGKPYQIYNPPRAVLRMPGFPALLALGMKTSDALGASERRPLVTRIVLAIVGTLACGLLYPLGRDLFDRRVGLVATGLAAFSPAFVAFSVLELSETAFAAMLTLSLWCFVRLLIASGFSISESNRLPAQDPATPAGRSSGRVVLAWAFAAGVATASANLVRPSWMLAVPAMVAALVWAGRFRFRECVSGLVLVVGFVAALAPWAWRNDRVTGHWIWTTLWVGPSLYDGLNPDATGDSDMSFFEQDALPQRMSEYEVDREYRQRALAFARNHPGRAAKLALLKSARYWNPIPNTAQFSHWAIRALFALSSLVTIGGVALALWGVRGSWVAWAICAGPLFYFGAVHSVFVGSIRYRLPAEYPLLALSAGGYLTRLARNKGNGLP